MRDCKKLKVSPASGEAGLTFICRLDADTQNVRDVVRTSTVERETKRLEARSYPDNVTALRSIPGLLLQPVDKLKA